jgi:hypothetical protein
MSQITIIVHKLRGTYRYTGQILEQGENFIYLEAKYIWPDTPFLDMIIKQGDRFVEIFYTDRWYSIYEIHDRENDLLKGWYCNIGYPAQLSGDKLNVIDLALDLFVYPDGRQLVLDVDEFQAMYLPQEARRNAQEALAELQELFTGKLYGRENIHPLSPLLGPTYFHKRIECKKGRSHGF